jgi:hypothetical protein
MIIRRVFIKNVLTTIQIWDVGSLDDHMKSFNGSIFRLGFGESRKLKHRYDMEYVGMLSYLYITNVYFIFCI